MKKAIFSMLTIAFLAFACSEDDEVVMIDSTLPQGEFSADRMGSFVDQNNAGSTGSATLGTDVQGVTFLRFSDNFNTALATGTVTVFLSTSENFTPDPGNGNPNLLLVGPVRSSGENFFRIPDGSNTSRYSHVILWCGSAAIPFGYAPLQ